MDRRPFLVCLLGFSVQRNQGLGERNGLSSCPDVGLEQGQDVLSGHVRVPSFGIEVTSGDTNIWTVKHRVQMEAGFKAHLPYVLTAQGSAWWCLGLLVNLLSHRGGIHLITVKHLLGASHGSSPESSRLGYPSRSHWPNGGASIHSFTTVL